MTERELKNTNEILNLYTGKTPFDFIEYIHWDGINSMNSTEGAEPFDASGRVYYQNGIKGISGIWPNFSPKVAGEVLLNFYTPLYYEGKITGVLTGVIGGTTNIEPILNSAFFGQNITGLLCDDEFNVIASNAEGIAPGFNLLKHTDVQIISDMIGHAEFNDSVPFKYFVKRKEGICCVAPVKNTGWHVIMFVYPRILAKSMTNITFFIYVLAVTIAVILLFFLLFHLRMSRQASQEIEESQMNVINALGLVYQNVYSVNISTGGLVIYRMSDKIRSKYGTAFPAGNYEDAVKLYVENEVFEDDRYLFDPVLNVQKVLFSFDNKNEYSFQYRVRRDGGIHYFQACYLRSSEDSVEFACGFKDVDLLMAKHLEDEKRMTAILNTQSTQISILSSLFGIYLTSHLIELEKDMVVELNTSKEVREIVNRNVNASSQMAEVIKKIAKTEYVQEMMAFTNLKTNARRLLGKKILSKKFIGRHHGWTKASFIPVETEENAIPSKVLFVTQVIEDEKRREQTLIDSANVDELTGLLNRHAYEVFLRELRAGAIITDMVYISFDVNGLKNINDTLGHEAGDELIHGAASCLDKSFSPYGKVFRTGGDEFQAVISAGYVRRCEVPELSISEIIKLADQKMYRAKSLYYASEGIDRRGQQAAFEVVCHSYEKILKVDLTSDSFSIVQMHTEEKDDFKGYNERISLWLSGFGNSGFVHEDDKDEFHNVIMEMLPAKEYTAQNQIIYLYVKNIDDIH